MEKFNEASVIELRSEIESKFREFMIDSAKPTVKAAARRSRKRTSELTLLLKKIPGNQHQVACQLRGRISQLGIRPMTKINKEKDK